MLLHIGMKKVEDLTVADVEKAIGSPAELWKGNCFAIASEVVEAGLVKGVAVYGHFRGKVDPRSYFGMRSGLAFIQHGWVQLDDGRVFDPTRWGFEDREPYLYLHPLTSDYDEGGNEINSRLRGGPPGYDPTEDTVSFSARELPTEAYNLVEKLLEIDVSEQEPGTFTKGQIFWLANAHYDHLKPHAQAIYLAIEKKGMGGFVPIDNRKRAQRGG